MKKITGTRIALLVDNYFEQAELEEPMKAYRKAGATVDIITTADDKELQGLNHVEFGDTFTADKQISEARADEYDALVIPGGAINADSLRVDTTAQEWLLDFLDAGKPVAIICHAPWLLVSADAVEGKRLTSFYTIRDDIENAGGEWVDLPVVIDENLITSRKPDDIPRFNDALITMIHQQGATTIPAGVVSESINDSQAPDNDPDKLDDDYDADELDEALADERTDEEDYHLSGVSPINTEEYDTY